LKSVSTKAAAFAESGALAVDMETAAIAEVCSRAAVPALFLRAISDGATDEIPLPFEASYDMVRQRARPMGVCLALLRSPRRIPRFFRFLGDLKRARASLTRTIREVLVVGAASGWRSD
jgi:adenosylhomocysteine nucleosidase